VKEYIDAINVKVFPIHFSLKSFWFGSKILTSLF